MSDEKGAMLGAVTSRGKELVTSLAISQTTMEVWTGFNLLCVLAPQDFEDPLE